MTANERHLIAALTEVGLEDDGTPIMVCVGVRFAEEKDIVKRGDALLKQAKRTYPKWFGDLTMRELRDIIRLDVYSSTGAAHGYPYHVGQVSDWREH